MVFKKKDLKAVGSLAAMMAAILCVTVACLPAPSPTGTPTPPPTSSTENASPAPIPSTATPAPTGSPEKAMTAATPADRWSELARRTPYPYSTPLPAAQTTILDGTYTKVDPRQAEHVPCKRCPAYPPGGGVWKLSLDKGIFRVYHPLTEWVTITVFRIPVFMNGDWKAAS
jgi:hypothetical protein